MLEVINVSSNIIRKAAIKKILLFFICYCFLSLSANGQNFDFKNYQVSLQGEILQNPFTGGYNAPQLNEMDFNLDGQMDLLVFDRSGDVIRPYVHDGVSGSTNYTYEPKYLLGLPELKQFVRVVDYNGDGVPDLFSSPTPQGGGLVAYTGMWDGQRLRFSLYETEFFNNYLTMMLNGAPTNIYVGPGDVPAILDVDNDGDIDILSFESGGSFVSFNKNMAIENGLPLDSLVFELGDFCWGKFKEGGLDGTIFLSDNSNQCAEGFAPEIDATERHAGSTLEAFDYQCDGDYDLLVGDLLGNNLVLLINEPVGEKDFIADTIFEFPLLEPVDIHVFPSSWVLDIDHDGDLDMVACPNEKDNALNARNFLFYENVGPDCNTQFEFKNDELLGPSSIDLGTDSNPAFCDYNADGLLDLLVGTTGVYDDFGQEQKAALVLFENVGDSENPKFEMVDDDYLSFSVNTMFSINPAPCFGDLDGDGDLDLLVGDNAGKLFYYENTAGPNSEFEFAQAVFPFKQIDVGQSVHPYILDYNGDGLGDIFIGERNSNVNDNGSGNISYFENIGTVGNPDFDNDSGNGTNTPTFGYIHTRLVTESAGFSAPALFYLENELYVMCGANSGYLQFYSCDENNVDEPCAPIDMQFGKLYEGDQTAIDLADIDADGYLEIVIGNKRGGLAIYNTIINVDGTISSTDDKLSELYNINLFPNPTNEIVHIESENELSEFTISNIFGQVVMDGKLQDNRINLKNINPGIYFVSFKIGADVAVKKLMKNQ